MIEFKSFSQAGQDYFAFEQSGFALLGSFVDFGCNDPFVNNNTAALELKGWKGIAIDVHDFDYSRRPGTVFLKSPSLEGVSRVIQDIASAQNGMVNYLSVDVDDATVGVMRSIPFDKVRFGCITVEHDSYRVGDGLKKWVFSVLSYHGYRLAHEDVKAPVCDGMPWSGQPFEDWYIPNK